MSTPTHLLTASMQEYFAAIDIPEHATALLVRLEQDALITRAVGTPDELRDLCLDALGRDERLPGDFLLDVTRGEFHPLLAVYPEPDDEGYLAEGQAIAFTRGPDELRRERDAVSAAILADAQVFDIR